MKYFITIFFLFAQTVGFCQNSLIDSLKKGGYILYFRHDSADVGSDIVSTFESGWWKSCDAAKARQMNDKGRNHAQTIGKVLRVVGAQIDNVYSSEYCRCVETANLMYMGVTTKQIPQLSFDIAGYGGEAARTAMINTMLTYLPAAGKNTIMVSHPMGDLQWGDAAVYKVEQKIASSTTGTSSFVGYIRSAEWTARLNTTTNLMDKLKEGGYVIHFRHATAPGGSPPSGSGNDSGAYNLQSMAWKSCEPTKARQLNADGWLEAKTIGEVFQKTAIPVAKILSSEFCRCFTTADSIAKKIGLTTVTTPDLTYLVYDNLPERREARTIKLLSQVTPGGQNTVLVSHAALSFSDTLYSIPHGNWNWSDALIYRPSASGAPVYMGAIRKQEWFDKLRVLTSVHKPQHEPVEGIELYPNPVSEDVMITISGDTRRITYAIYSLLGVRMFSGSVGSGTTPLNLRALNDGYYILHLQDEKGGVLTKGFIKGR